MRRLIYLILLIPAITYSQVKIDRDTVFVRDYLFVEDTAEIYGINAGQVTDSTIYLEEPNSGNYFDLKLSSFQPPYLDYYGQDTSGNYYIGGGQGFSTLYYYADSGNGNYILNYNTLPSAQYLITETSESAITTYNKYMDQRTNFRTWYLEHYPNGVTSDRAKIELDADFFEITLKNTSVLNVDTAGKMEVDSITDGAYTESTSDIIRPDNAWAHFTDSTIIISLTVDTWETITNSTDSLFRLVNLNGISVNNDTINLNKALYIFSYQLSVAGTLNNIYEVRVMMDGQELRKTKIKAGSSGDYLAAIMNMNIYADTNSKLWVEIRNISGSNEINIYDGSWSLLYIYKL